MIIKSFKYFFLYGAVLWTASCHLFEPKDEREVIARVGKAFLYLEDLEEVLKGKNTLEDSLAAMESYVNSWTKTQALLQKAEFNLGDQKKAFEKQIEDYRTDLLIFAYQQAYLKEKLDTQITVTELEDYYKQNSNNFLLKENILKADYAVFPVNVPKKQDLIKNFNSNKEKDMENFRQATLKYSRALSLDDTSWIPMVELAKLMPLNEMTQGTSLAPKRSFVYEDSLSLYFLKIQDFNSIGEAAPLFYVENTIRNILLNRRKLKLQAELEENIYNQALKNKEIEIFLPAKPDNTASENEE